MRQALAFALLTLLPAASALGVGPAAVDAEVDLPLLAPVRVDAPLPVIVAHAIEARAPPEPLAPRIDGALHAPRLAHRVEPPPIATGEADPLVRGPTALGPSIAREAVAAPAALPLRADPAPKLALAPAPPPPAPSFLGPARAEAPAPRALAADDPAPPLPPPGRRPDPVAASAALLVLLAPAMALYHRRRAAATDRDTRAQVLALVRARAGTTRADVARELGIDPTTARYHLLRLAREGLVAIEGTRGRQRAFATDTVAPDARAKLAAMDGRAPILRAVREAPGLRKVDLSRSLALARGSVDWHLRALSRAGVVRLEREGRSVRVFPISF